LDRQGGSIFNRREQVLWLTKIIVGLRASDAAEVLGLDISQHREKMGT
jgi:ammonia channel protein AmtB